MRPLLSALWTFAVARSAVQPAGCLDKASSAMIAGSMRERSGRSSLAWLHKICYSMSVATDGTRRAFKFLGAFRRSIPGMSYGHLSDDLVQGYHPDGVLRASPR